MKSLLRYYAKKRIPVLSIVVFIALVISVAITATTAMVVRFRTDRGVVEYVSNTYLYYLTTMMAIFATLIPIYEFSFKMRKNSIDLFYSLPVKRNKLYIAKYLIGMVELFIIFTVCFIYVFIFAAISVNGRDVEFHIVYYVPYYFTILGLGFLLYNFIAFFYTRGNSAFDGILLTLLSVFAVTLVASFVYAIIGKIQEPRYHPYTGQAFNFTAYSLIYHLTSIYSTLLTKSVSHPTPTVYLPSFITMLIVFVALVPLFFILNNSKKAEDTGDINTEWYLYKTFIPLYIICIYATITAHPFYMILVPVAGYVGYVINNRSFKIKKWDIIFLASSTLIGAVIGILMTTDITISI